MLARIRRRNLFVGGFSFPIYLKSDLQNSIVCSTMKELIKKKKHLVGYFHGLSVKRLPLISIYTVCSAIITNIIVKDKNRGSL